MLNIALYTNDIALTSQLSDVTIQTSADYVDITFSADGSKLLSGRYYALNGSVIIGNLACFSGSSMPVCGAQSFNRGKSVYAYVALQSHPHYSGITPKRTAYFSELIPILSPVFS